MKTLNHNILSSLSNAIEIPQLPLSQNDAIHNRIVHFGIGAFHRSHQAYALQKLNQLSKDEQWEIVGIGMMPKDKELIEHLRNQDYLYSLRSISSKQVDSVHIIDAMNSAYHTDGDLEIVLENIAHKNTKVISFTITEGGYKFNFDTHSFLINDPDIHQDLDPNNTPKTIYGVLARGLEKRMKQNTPGLYLLSCDNIIENGEVLKTCLLNFLYAYNPELCDWAEKNILFPNSMVDRITPATREEDKQQFQKKFGYRDEALVISEDYFQWVIQKPEEREGLFFPALDKVGAEFVSQVTPYEKMKLGILNGGHTLVGLLGDYKGYAFIDESVVDPLIDKYYTQYVLKEVIPALQPIQGVDFSAYFEIVKDRFSNVLIHDQVSRILSGSSDKFPKFILPILEFQLKKDHPNIRISSLIVAVWWNYLYKQFLHNRMENVVDNAVDNFKACFEAEGLNSQIAWLNMSEIFGDLANNPQFLNSYQKALEVCKNADELSSYLID